MAKTKTVNGITWTYCDSEGMWWSPNDGHRVFRSDSNQSKWELLKAGDNYPRGPFKTMKRAMEDV